MNDSDVLDLVKWLCDDNKSQLLYLCRSGSFLYGTTTSDSDSDFVGVYAPSIEDLILRRAPTTIIRSSGNDESSNKREDYDITLFSLQYWLEKVHTLEVTVIDLLFSHTHREAVLYQTEIMDKIFNNKYHLLEAKPSREASHVRYAQHQAKRYGLKGLVLDILNKTISITESFLNNRSITGEDDLGIIALEVMYLVNNTEFVDIGTYEKKIGGNYIKYMYVCGKQHHLTIPINSFLDRLHKERSRYGKRSRQAQENLGIDWKATYHAVRAIRQIHQLYTTGEIIFPLSCAEELLQIKKGEIDLKIVEQKITDGIANVEEITPTNALRDCRWDQEFVDNLILNYYLGD